jgi:hypothetical protein
LEEAVNDGEATLHDGVGVASKDLLPVIPYDTFHAFRRVGWYGEPDNIFPFPVYLNPTVLHVSFGYSCSCAFRNNMERTVVM